MMLPSTPLEPGDESRPRTIVVRYEHEIDALDRVAGILRRQRGGRSLHGGGVARSRHRAGDHQFDRSDKTAARIVSLLIGRSAFAVEDWTSSADSEIRKEIRKAR